MHNYQIYPDAEAAAEAAADYLQQQIVQRVTQKGACHIALAGGSTPVRCLQLLAEKKLPWQKIHWYLTDERCLPSGDAERNDTMITSALWSRAAVPADNCHAIRAELGAEQAAADYQQLLQTLTRLDIVLLGMGEDGHTASLFPDSAALNDARLAVPVFAAPKPPPERVTMGKTTLQAAGQRIALVTGSSKSDALCKVRLGEPLPINFVGEIEWFVDKAAAKAIIEHSEIT